MDYTIEDFIISKKGNEVVKIEFLKGMPGAIGYFSKLVPESESDGDYTREELRDNLISCSNKMYEPFYTGGEENCDIVYIIDTAYGYELCTKAAEAGMLLIAFIENYPVYRFDTENGLL